MSSTPQSAGEHALKRFRDHQTGNGWTWVSPGTGKSYHASCQALSDGAPPDWIPDGVRNAGDADPHSISFSPSDFTNRTGPIYGQTVVRDATGVSYTVARGYLTDGQMAWRCLVYKTPQANSATVALTGETGAGSRKKYVPPDAT